MSLRSRLLDLAGRLDEMGHYDISDSIESIFVSAETTPAPQPQIQQLPEKITTMRGPAGWALVQDEGAIEESMGHGKQVREEDDEKDVDSKGVSVGGDVAFDSTPEEEVDEYASDTSQ